MLRRSAVSLLLVAGLALTGAACGGSGASSSTTGTQSTSPGGDADARAVLGAIRTDVSEQGPQKLTLKLTASIDGSPKDPTLGIFLSKPISLTLSGPVDTKAKKSDVTFELAAGPIKVDGGLRQVGDESFLQVNGTWYALGKNALSTSSGTATGTTTTSSALDPQGLLAAFGDPEKLFTHASLDGTEDVDGIASDHVTGALDLAALVKGLSSVTGSASGTSASPVSPGQISAGVKSLQQYVRSATADVWVGQKDKQVHRFATTIKGVTDASTKASSGIESFSITLDASATPTSSPSVSAPSNPAPVAQLESDLGGLLGGLSAGGTTTG